MPANTPSAEIQRIVQEVLRRLEQTALGYATATTSETPSKTGESKSNASTQLVWSQSVVSAEALCGRLDGVNQLMVGPKAIVTPAARDELREREIHVVRQNDHDVTLRKVQVAVQEDAVANQTSHAIQITSDDQWTAFFTRSIQQNETPVAVSRQPHRLACLANRDHDVRAVAVTDLREMEEAVRQTHANVLCVSPSVLAVTPLSVVSRRFQQVAVANGGTA